jgi:hypothetical protein
MVVEIRRFLHLTNQNKNKNRNKKAEAEKKNNHIIGLPKKDSYYMPLYLEH